MKAIQNTKTTMALLDAHGNPIIATPIPVPAQAAAVGQPLIDINQLRMAFSNPKADIPLFYRNATMDNVNAKFLFNRVKIALTTYG